MDLKNNNEVDISSSQIMGDWVPRRMVQNFFNYGNTKMSTFATDYNVKTSKVGKRIFYNYHDIKILIEKNVLNSSQDV